MVMATLFVPALPSPLDPPSTLLVRRPGSRNREAPRRLVVPVGDRPSGAWGVIPGSGPPPLAGLRGGPCRASIVGVAVIERIGSSEARPYVVAWGTLTKEDEDRLGKRVAAQPHVDVTVDLCEVEEITADGCDALRNVAEDMRGRGQTMVVLYLPNREATRSLERTGLLDDGRIVFVASSPMRRVNLDA
jgi:anti-anti-sigma regulatory factor